MGKQRTFQIRPIGLEDRGWVSLFLAEHWGEARVVTRGRIHQADRLPGFIAESEDDRIGLVTYQITGIDCELVSLNSSIDGLGVGRALLDQVKATASARACQRLWLITTNDNTKALRFYQRYGFRFKALYPEAITQSRQLKPSIPLLGNDDIPIRDELELELWLEVT
ncbi:GNAT family N-acetyltransferase [bacterium]|nr:GNAT family N-acetyltransferase [bacterium]